MYDLAADTCGCECDEGYLFNATDPTDPSCYLDESCVPTNDQCVDFAKCVNINGQMLSVMLIAWKPHALQGIPDRTPRQMVSDMKFRVPNQEAISRRLELQDSLHVTVMERIHVNGNLMI